jgi:hypothetical protein
MNTSNEFSHKSKKNVKESMDKTKKKRCPNGFRRDKSGNCVPTQKNAHEPEPAPAPEIAEVLDKKKRCPKGTRRDKSGNCVPTKQPSPKKPSPKKPSPDKKKRCPKGTRRNKNGDCVSTAKPIPEPVPEVIPEPISEIVPEPISEIVPEPISEVAPEPISEVAPEPISEVAPKPAFEKPIPKKNPIPTRVGEWLPYFSDKHNRWYWVHQKTGEKTWEKPKYADQPRNLRIPLYPQYMKPEHQWKAAYSDKHKKWWWFNKYTGEKTWQNPHTRQKPPASVNPVTEKPVTIEKPVAAIKPVALVKPHIAKPIKPVEKPFVAIIVPFRDLHKAQERKKHLDRFVPEISAFLQKSGKPFKIYIVEQSDDDCKFNRGKLLNIGFEMAVKDGAQVFVFHDVDLIPSDNLLPFYTNVPPNPVHIARVWNRYSGNKSYFGGVVAFSKKQFADINGFPNNYWGWGGEDDELFMRVKEVGLSIDFPTEGTFIDMENMNLQEKLKFLKTNQTLKCMNKYELLADHTATWTSNGLKNLDYKLIDETTLDSNGYKYVVDLLDKEHCNEQMCVLPRAKR